MKLSVIIPAYNEEQNFRSGSLDLVLEYLNKQEYAWELILVDDGSTDATPSLLQSFSKKSNNIKLFTIEHGGKVAAVCEGIKRAVGEVQLFSDFDQSTPLWQVEKFLQAHENGADVVIGIRSHTSKDSLVRKIRTKLFVTLVQVVALPGIIDSQCGFKSFTKKSAQKIFSNLKVTAPSGAITGGYMGAFDVEVLFLARKFNFRISQVPVEWIKYVSDRLNIWKEPLQMVKDTFVIRLYDILGKYHEN